MSIEQARLSFSNICEISKKERRIARRVNAWIPAELLKRSFYSSVFWETLSRRCFVRNLSCVSLWNISSLNIFSMGVIALPSALFPLRILIKGLPLTCLPTSSRPCYYGASNKSISCFLPAYLLKLREGSDRASERWRIGTTQQSPRTIPHICYLSIAQNA